MTVLFRNPHYGFPLGFFHRLNTCHRSATLRLFLGEGEFRPRHTARRGKPRHDPENHSVAEPINGWTWREDLATLFGFTTRNLEKNMSDIDIYTNREQDRSVPPPSTTGKRRRRRSSKRQLFDDEGNRNRRSKNSGFRRLRHLSKKGANGKKFWWGLLVSIVVALILIAIWQFWLLEQIAREQSRRDERHAPLPNLPQTDSAANSAAE